MLDRFVNLLKSGAVIAFPTETVYGLGADAWNRSAVEKVFAIKGRPADNPLIVHISSQVMLQDFAAHIPDEAKLLMNDFWPGPLTLIFKKKSAVLDIVTGGLDTVAIRWPAHPLSQDLIARSGALVAPSANSSGRPSPTNPAHIKHDFGTHFPVVEAGTTQIGLESTVLDISQSPFCLYRPGAISQQRIEEVIGQSIEVKSASASNEAPKSPGLKYSHYSPDARIRWLNKKSSFDSVKTLYLLHSVRPKVSADNIISYDEDYDEMAHQLYDRFRQADAEAYEQVAIEPFTEAVMELEPLAAALQNRISKAIG